MGQLANQSAKYRFGTFELDRRTVELRKHGIRLKLQEQPYRILSLLLDRPGEVITREQICRALWPQNTFVEFERSLNAAVAKLRQVLGDSAENPRFIETVARRGYRFIAPVEAIDSTELASSILTPQPALAVQRKTRWISAALMAALITMATGAFFLFRHPRASAIPEITRLTFDSGLTTDPAVSPDGRLLAYASDRDGGGHLHIWVQQLSSNGQAVQLTRGDSEDHQPAFSPDGSKIVFRSEREGGALYLISAIGGDPTFLTKEGRDPRFSPDGRWIAYWTGFPMRSPITSNDGTTYVVPAGGGTSLAVSTDLAGAGNPIWSPDSKHLFLFGTKKKDDFPSAGNFDWWVVPIQGGTAAPTGGFEYLRKRGFIASWWDTPRVASWTDKGLLFFGRVGDCINLWKVYIDASTYHLTGEPKRLTFGAGFDAHPTLTSDGRLVFANLIDSLDVWMLSADTNRDVVRGHSQRITETVGPHQAISLSANGKVAAYLSVRSGNPRIWLKDFESGKETPLDSGDGSVHAPVISADGSLLVYLNINRNGNGMVMPTRGGPSQRICTECATSYDLSPDNQVALYRKDTSIRAFDLLSHRDSPFVESRRYQVFQTKFAPDKRWILFQAVQGPRSKVFIAALRDTTSLVPESEWIPIVAEQGWADKPRWSPDGKSIYFISNRDGNFCVWAQRVHAQTKRPIGVPIPVAHFHGSRLSMGTIGFSSIGLAVAQGKIAFNLAETTGNIWVTNLPQ